MFHVDEKYISRLKFIDFETYDVPRKMLDDLKSDEEKQK